MKTSEKFWAVTLGLAAIEGIFYGAAALGDHQERILEQRRRQALEDAKNGWIYVCGWSQCTWNRIPPAAPQEESK